MAETDLILAAKATLVEPVMVDGEVGPMTLNSDGRLRVASKPGYFPPISGDLSALGNTLVADVTDASNLTLHIKNIGTAAMAAGAFVFEGSVDSTDGSDGTWFTIQAVRSDSNTVETGRATLSLAANAAQNYAWELSVNAIRWFRIRCSVALTASSVAKWTIIRGTYATEPIPAIQSHPVTVSGIPTVTISGTPTVAGTSTTTPVTPQAFSVVSAASTNPNVHRAASGNLFEITASNPTATAAVLKLYNKASAPTVGTDVPLVTIPIPANSVIAMNFGAVGKRFTLGISSAITALIASTDTGSAVAGIQVSGSYV